MIQKLYSLQGAYLKCRGTIKRTLGRMLGNSGLWSAGVRDYLTGQLQVEGGLQRQRAEKIVSAFRI